MTLVYVVFLKNYFEKIKIKIQTRNIKTVCSPRRSHIFNGLLSPSYLLPSLLFFSPFSFLLSFLSFLPCPLPFFHCYPSPSPFLAGFKEGKHSIHPLPSPLHRHRHRHRHHITHLQTWPLVGRHGSDTRRASPSPLPPPYTYITHHKTHTHTLVNGK